MRVRLTVDIEIDPKVWDTIYGRGTEPGAVREDVRSYVETALQGQPGFTDEGTTGDRSRVVSVVLTRTPDQAEAGLCAAALDPRLTEAPLDGGWHMNVHLWDPAGEKLGVFPVRIPMGKFDVGAVADAFLTEHGYESYGPWTPDGSGFLTTAVRKL